MALMNAMPPAASASDRNLGGIVHSSDVLEYQPADNRPRQMIAASVLADDTVSRRTATVPIQAAAAKCHRRSSIRSELRQISSIPMAPIAGGKAESSPTIKT